MEEYKLILSTDMLDEFKEMNKGTWKKLQKFVPGSPRRSTGLGSGLIAPPT